jgi:hypothetical protein
MKKILYGGNLDRIPMSHWQELENRRKYLDWLGEKLKFSTMDSWYKLRDTNLLSNGGGHLLRLYDGSLGKMLSSIYSDTTWHPWIIREMESSVDPSEIRSWIEWVGKNLNVWNPEDWYRIRRSSILEFIGAKNILSIGGGTLSIPFRIAYPEIEWYPWLFQEMDANYWYQLSNQRKFYDWLAEQINVRSLEDWYNITIRDVVDRGGGGILILYQDDNQWMEKEKFSRRTYLVNSLRASLHILSSIGMFDIILFV